MTEDKLFGALRVWVAIMLGCLALLAVSATWAALVTVWRGL